MPLTRIKSLGITDGTIVNADINASAAIVSTKLSGVANTPAFSAYQSSTQSVSTGTNTKILFQTEVFDTDNNFDSSRFTPTVAGKYLLTVGLRMSSGNTEYIIYIAKNGLASGSFTLVDADFANNYGMSGSAIVVANGTTDYFEGYCYQGSGTSKTTSADAGQTFFQGFKLIGV
jgi:hypothetical protein